MANTYGVTPQGFVLKRLADILSDYQTALSTVTDPVTGEALTPNLADENDPLVLLVNSCADADAALWELGQAVYNMFDPLSSSGQALQSLVQLNGITAFGGTYSTVIVNLIGTPNYTMPSGAQCGDQQGTIVFNLPQITFDSSGNANGIIATCTQVGPNAPDPNTAGVITKMVTPLPGWGSVTNPGPVIPGLAQESDEQLRQRQQVSTSNTAGTIIEAWYSALIAVSGVTFARIYQNVGATEDSRGIPGQSIAPVVVGGLDNDVANCIMSKISVAQTFGSTEVDLTDALGTVYPIQFTRPAVVNIAIAMSIHIINSTIVPDDVNTQIEDAIVLFWNEGMDALGIANVYDQNGYIPGQSVFSSDLYPAILSIPGIQLVSLFIGLIMPAPTLATHGSAGSTSYSYAVTAIDGNGKESLATVGTIATGNATLDSSNYNILSWAAVPGSASYKVYRTASGGTPNTTGLIGNPTAATLNDIGLAATTGSPPTAPSAQSVEIAWNQIAAITEADISVTHV